MRQTMTTGPQESSASTCVAAVSLARMCAPQGADICLFCPTLGSQNPVCAPYRYVCMNAAVYHTRGPGILPCFQVGIGLQVSKDKNSAE